MTTLSNETEARLRAEVERNTAPFRDRDIAGQCVKLRRHANNCTPAHEERGLDLDGMAFAFYGAANTLERQAAEIKKLREALKRARRYVADLPIVGDADLSIIDAALTGEDPGTARAG